MADSGVIGADVAVVGAGLSGLAAALRIQQAGRSVVVLEARDRVGGRTLNEPIGDGDVVELGGQWIGPRHAAVRSLAAAVAVDTFPTHIAGEHLFAAGGRTRRFRGHHPQRATLGAIDFRLAQARLERQARSVVPDAPHLTADAERLDAQTLASWMARNMRTKAGRALMASATRAVLAVEPADLSLLHWLFYLRVSGGLTSLLRTDGGYQQDRFVGGSQEVSIRLAQRLGGSVRLGAPVSRIEHDEQAVRLHAGEAIVESRLAILALPPACTGDIAFDPALPSPRQKLALHMPHGAVFKYMAVFARPFWREEGLSGHAITDQGPATVFFDNSPPSANKGVLLAFVLADQARHFRSLDHQDRHEAVLAGLTDLFGPRAAAPERLLERSWGDSQWTPGCYAGYFGPGGWSAFGDVLRTPVNRMHWAGTETAVMHQGSMDGAVTAGHRAADEVLQRLKDPQARGTSLAEATA